MFFFIFFFFFFFFLKKKKKKNKKHLSPAPFSGVDLKYYFTAHLLNIGVFSEVTSLEVQIIKKNAFQRVK
jgi:hypothetical protein